MVQECFPVDLALKGQVCISREERGKAIKGKLWGEVFKGSLWGPVTEREDLVSCKRLGEVGIILL